MVLYIFPLFLCKCCISDMKANKVCNYISSGDDWLGHSEVEFHFQTSEICMTNTTIQ